MQGLKICNMSLPLYLTLLCVTLLAVATGSIGTDVVAVILFLYLMGGALFYIGDKMPIVGRYLGGSLLLPLIGGSFLVYAGLISPTFIEAISHFISSGFMDLVLSTVIVGAILSIDRTTLIKTSLRLIPCILGAQVFAFGFLALASILTGTSLLEGIYMIGLPNFGGGSSGGVVALPSFYSELFGNPVASYSGVFIVFMNIANVVCVLFASLLNILGQKYPSLTGRGCLLRGIEKEACTHVAAEPAKKKEYDAIVLIGVGCIVSLCVFVAGRVICYFLPFLNYVAWATILAVIIKVFGVADEFVAESVNKGQSFMVKTFLPMFIMGIGVANVNLQDTIALFSFGNLFIITMGILGAVLGSLVFALIFRLHPVDAMIGVGCNCAALGSSGSMTILSATNRMALMPYSTITNRIGGAIMLIAVNISIYWFL